MAIDHHAVQLALRTRARTVEVVTTGATSLGATAAAYTRPSGSFVTDGFSPGMEVSADGFSSSGNNGLAVVTRVEAQTLTVDRALSSESASGGSTLSVGLPSRVAYENVDEDEVVTPGAPWVREELVSGPTRLLTTAENGTIEFDPLYHLHVSVPAGVGIGAHNRYADALLALFRPNQTIPLSGGDAIRVRTDASSFRGPVRHVRPGFATVRVTFPLRLHLINA